MATMKDMQAEVETLEDKIVDLLLQMDNAHNAPELMKIRGEYMTLCHQQRQLKQKLYARKHPNIKTMFNHRARKG